MPSNALCSIAVFHDGSYVARARGHFHHQSKAGWLQIGGLHALIESEARRFESTYEKHCVTYAAWFQGVSDASQLQPKQLAKDRELQHDLMAVGVHPHFLPMAHSKEKGVDVALAISALEVAFTNRIDMVALVTGDADFVPLIWSLKRRGIRVGVFGFHYKHPSNDQWNSSMAATLRDAAHFHIDVAALENERPEEFQRLFVRRRESTRPRAGNGTSMVEPEDGD